MHVSKIRVNKKNYQDFIKRMFLYKSVEVQSPGRPYGMAFYNYLLKRGSCSWNWEKLKIIRHQHLRQVRVYVFPCSISLMQWEVKPPAKISTELIKRRSKIHENNMSCQCASYFDQWKIFSANESLIMACLQNSR